MITEALLIVLVSIFAFFLKKALKINKYWEERGVKHLKPVPFFGNNLSMVLGQRSLPEIVESLYAKYPNELVLGFYDFMVPRLYVRDPDLIQKVLIKDFGHFTDHGMDIDTKTNPRDEQLFVINGAKWRAVRMKLTPLFTSGKLKEMFSTMTSVGENLLEYIKEREKGEIDARELMGLFSMDVISSAVFGMDPATLKNPDSEFRKLGKKINEQSIKNLFRMWMIIAFPYVAKKLKLSMQDKNVQNYFCNIIENTFEYRKEKGIQRNDFIQMMMQLKEKGHVDVQSLDETDDYLKSDEYENNVEKVEFTDDLLMSQAQAFMIAGFEATALLMAFTMFELTQHEDLQKKICEEVAEQVKLHGGLTYEALRDMKLLEASIKETQRLYPLVPAVFRVCTKKYELPAAGYVVEKGEMVAVPVAAIHMDPNNYPDPKTYKPERFLDPIKPGTFMPFGDGPRMCIAMRYTMLVMKYGLAIFFMNYRVTLSPKTPRPLKIIKRAFSAFPKDQILVHVHKL